MIGTRLRELRLREELSQSTLGKLVGTSGQRIWQWESENSTPAADMVARLAQSLNTSADYLLGLTDDPAPSGDSKKNLSLAEQAVINAMRRGDPLEAVRVIVNGAEG